MFFFAVSYTVSIRCTVICVLSAQIGEFQCIFTKPYTKNDQTVYSGQLSVLLPTGNQWHENGTPNQYSDYSFMII